MKLAVDPLTMGVPSGLLPIQNVTLPDNGVPEGVVAIVAVKVTGEPCLAGLTELVSVVVLVARTVSVAFPELDVLFASPL